ncbi:hypothetical protein HPB50_019241 [Hyalomma asiaticum]|uniref:Uncharacterized protein n=1 Tax=Hyalomma asiaticum TaxID=266040 RepID=A0ACB7S522_HYAAI|nr:hypothetical protein HPB50_019241 [Hyalomma asiaticum]
MAVVLWNIRYVCSRIHFDPDASRNVSELITSKGYPVEERTVTTEDGYLLRVQRIPHGRSDGAQKRKYRVLNGESTPVLVLHGTAMSSADFVLNFPHQSLGFLLADAGYDVWLGNFRGNIYTSHTRYSSVNPFFWNFSVVIIVNANPGLGPAQTFLRLTGSGGLMVNTALTKLQAALVCGSDFTVDLCIAALAVMNGINWKQLNILIRCNCFRKYDYGMLLNILNYRTWRPPRYELSRVQVPVAMYHSAGDWYADPWDVARLQRELPTVVRVYTVADRRFTHYDFVVGTGDEAALMYGEMIRFMEQYRNDSIQVNAATPTL